MANSSTVLSPPIPAWQNAPIEDQFYEPSRFVISDIAKGPTTTVTTTVPHNYVISQQVRLIIPSAFGIYQLNERTGYVLSIPSSTQVVLDIDSTDMDSYVASPQTQVVSQILAIGDVGSGVINLSGRLNTGTFIPGSFINISPN